MQMKILIGETVIPPVVVMVWVLAIGLIAIILLTGLVISWKLSANPKCRIVGYSLTVIFLLLLVKLVKFYVHASGH